MNEWDQFKKRWIKKNKDFHLKQEEEEGEEKRNNTKKEEKLRVVSAIKILKTKKHKK